MFIGMDGMYWYEGVVEDNVDPEEIGRLQVRIFGIHTPQKVKGETEGIPTEELQWAHPVLPLTESSNSGIGQNTRVLKGSWVWGWFRDGKDCQMPVVAGTIPGIPKSKSDPSKGFNDPDGKYPLEDLLGEPDVNRLARNKNIDKTIIQDKKDSTETSVETSTESTWDEPETPYNAEYPYNQVKETESGHIIELDDTPESERIHVFHRSGTFIEVHPDGSVVKKIKGDNYEIIDNNGKVYIKGALDVTVDGDCNVYTKNNSTIKIDGDNNHIVGNNLDITVGGNVNQTVAGNVTQQIGGDVNQTVEGSATQTIMSGLDQIVTGDYTLEVSGSYNITIGGNKSENVTGTASRTATAINDDGAGATLSLAGAAALNGSTVSLG